jgi:uncharacterized membrane protein YfcA
MPEFYTDPAFYAAAVPAVFLVGLSKGGLGGAMGLIGVPLMALAMSPVRAAAILLPILIVMDVVSLWSWRGNYDRGILKTMMPGAMVGIGVGWLTAAMVTDEAIRLVVGAVAIGFVGRWLWQQYRDRGAVEKRPRNGIAASFWGTVAGFTSFVAHVGGPPYQVYTLPLGLDPKVFTGTSVIFFAITNAVKLVPYFALGQFDTTNLEASAILMPIAPLATLAGAFVVKRMRPQVFYPFTYVTVGIVAVKLVWDNAVGLF